MHERTRATTKTDDEIRAGTLFPGQAKFASAQVRLEQTRIERNTSVGWPVRDEQIMNERKREKNARNMDTRKKFGHPLDTRKKHGPQENMFAK